MNKRNQSTVILCIVPLQLRIHRPFRSDHSIIIIPCYLYRTTTMIGNRGGVNFALFILFYSHTRLKIFIQLFIRFGSTNNATNRNIIIE